MITIVHTYISHAYIFTWTDMYKHQIKLEADNLKSRLAEEFVDIYFCPHMSI